MLNVIRPLNVILAGATVLLGAWLTVVPLADLRPLLAVLIVMLFTAAGNIMNDVCDLQSDRINRPLRALPSGQLTVQNAKRFYQALFVGGSLLSLYQGLYWIALPALMLIIWYNLQLQKKALIGNVVVALLTVLPLWYAAGLSRPTRLLFPTLLILIIQLAREIVKDVEDMAGDRLQSARTLPLLIGAKPALAAACGLNIVLWTVAVLAWRLQYYQMILPLIVVAVIVPITVYGFLHAWRHAGWRQLQLILKLDMIIGFLALIMGVN